MSGFLFNDVIFGPVNSRRLGSSLGINLLPVTGKLCNFNCIYCECGLTSNNISQLIDKVPLRERVKNALETSLLKIKNEGTKLDSITFAGNGEPTLHPEFANIMDDVLFLRNTILPETKISILTNSTTSGKPDIFNALLKADQNIMKLDAGTEKMFRAINRCKIDITLEDIVKNLVNFKGNLIVQSLFLRVKINGRIIDNTDSSEIEAWLNNIIKIKPKMLMLYPIARGTPINGIEKINFDELNKIAIKANNLCIKTRVYE